jgi:hypothetical protein
MDRRFDLGPSEADVPQRAVVEFAKSCDVGAADEIAYEDFPTGAEKLSELTRCLPAGGPGDI